MRNRHISSVFGPILMMAAVVAGGQAAAWAQSQQAEVPRSLRAVGGGTQAAQVPDAPLRLQDASRTRSQLGELLQAHPPSLRRVLRLDPSILSNAQFLAPYPAVVEFLRQHPEVARDPAYFIGTEEQYRAENAVPLTPDQQLRSEGIAVWRNLTDGLGVFAVFLTVILTLTWLIRYVMGHRRWLRATKMHNEMQSRLLERFSQNEDLMAYLQSPTGRHLLTVMPSVEPVSTNSPLAAPFGRILWAVQAGVVLVCGGIGLLIIRRYVMVEVGDMLLTLGVLSLSLGVGFGLASLASFLISRRLGLIDTPATPTSNLPS